MGSFVEPHPVSGIDNGNGPEKLPHLTETEVPSEAQRDEQALARLGKKPILKVCWGHETSPPDAHKSDEFSVASLS